MTTAHVEKFAEMIVNDPALQAKLRSTQMDSDGTLPPLFYENLVIEAKALGLYFSVDEWVQYVAMQLVKVSGGEMTHAQLANISGGKTPAFIDSRQLAAQSLAAAGVAGNEAFRAVQHDPFTNGADVINYSSPPGTNANIRAFSWDQLWHVITSGGGVTGQ